MGSVVTLNDTLQITKAQGFPVELDFSKHQVNPFKTEDFAGRVFEFKNKEGVRIYQAPPVRVFLAENIEGKWLYWGQCYVLETKLDLENKVTSGKYKITKIFSVEEMKMAFEITDSRPEMNFFN